MQEAMFSLASRCRRLTTRGGASAALWLASKILSEMWRALTNEEGYGRDTATRTSPGARAELWVSSQTHHLCNEKEQRIRTVGSGFVKGLGGEDSQDEARRGQPLSVQAGRHNDASRFSSALTARLGLERGDVCPLD